MPDEILFVSYAGEDEPTARKIVAYLEAKGAKCWFAARDIAPATIYADAIVEGIQNSIACIVIVSDAANRSKGVKRELELASNFGKPYIPIRVGGAVPQQGLSYYLQNAQHVEYGSDGEASLARIIALLPGRGANQATSMLQATHLGWVVKIDLAAPAVMGAVQGAKEKPGLAVAGAMLNALLVPGLVVGVIVSALFFSKTHAIRTDDGEILQAKKTEIEDAIRGKPLPVRVTFRRENDQAIDVKAV